MIKDYEYLRRNEKFEKKIRIACDFHSAKYEFTQGRILNVDLSGDELDTQKYDRDNGEGAAEKALSIVQDY